MPRYSILAAVFLIPLLLFFSLSCEKNSPTEPEPAFFLTIISGNNQQGVQGDTLSTALTVLVTDKNGKAVTNKQVNFTIKEGTGTLSVENINTDENGQASAILILGNQQGKVTIEAKISGTNISTIFTAIIGIHKPYSIEIINGDGQVACPWGILPIPLQVIVKDEWGRLFEGAVVTFNIKEGTGSLSALSDTTSISGTAQTILTFSDSIGKTNIIASLQGTDSPTSVEFTANAVPPTIKIVSGNEQLGDPGDILPEPLQVKVVNNHDEPMDGIIVNFEIVDGNGSLSALSDTTDSLGVAQINIKLGDLVGVIEIIAEIQGVGYFDKVTFTARALPPGKIAFESFRDGNCEIYVMNADGSNQTNLTNNSAYDSSPSWSPDGSLIAFSSSRDGNFDIYIMNADGSNQTRLTNDSAHNFYPSWSPDGSQIAFESDRDGYGIYVMDADGSNQTRLTNNSADDRYPSWSPDGSQIAFWTNRDGNSEIYVMNADGSNQTRLTNNPDTDFYPSWSPDGSQIAFESDRDGYGIYVMDADGSNQRKLTNESDRYPSWSPDGSCIAFDSYRDGNCEIYVMNADGSDQIRLTNNPDCDVNPSWSPILSR